MQAAHDAAQIPLFVGEILDRGERQLYACLIKSIDIRATYCNHPEKIEPQCPQVIHRVELATKYFIENAVKPEQPPVCNSGLIMGDQFDTLASIPWATMSNIMQGKNRGVSRVGITFCG